MGGEVGSNLRGAVRDGLRRPVAANEAGGASYRRKMEPSRAHWHCRSAPPRILRAIGRELFWWPIILPWACGAMVVLAFRVWFLGQRAMKPEDGWRGQIEVDKKQ